MIDFSHVGLLDYSCANEVVAKLLLRFSTETPPSDAYFVFRGMQEWHLDAIETALSRYGLALVLEQGQDGQSQLVGDVADDEQKAWETLSIAWAPPTPQPLRCRWAPTPSPLNVS